MEEVIAWAKDQLACEYLVIDTSEQAITNPYLAGAHNATNAGFAIAIAKALQIDETTISAALDGYIGLPHRLQPVGQYGKQQFVNDSKATNGDATAKALSAYEPIIWLAGGMAKADGLSACRAYFDHVHSAYFYGECAHSFYESAKDALECYHFKSLDDAFAKALGNAPDEAVILLSPAAASFDQFENFGARGRHFETLVHAYIDAQKQEVSHAG